MEMPARLLLRRADLKNVGLKRYEVRKLIDANLLTPIYLPCKKCTKRHRCKDKTKCREKGRAFFSRYQLENLLK